MTVRRLYAGTAMVGMVVAGLAMALWACGARINTTRSIPVGLYWVSDAPISHGAYVFFCPPNTAVFSMAKERGYISAGFCPGDFGFMMKRVLAAKGDRVVIDDAGVFVNDQRLAHSTVLQKDPAGRVLPRYSTEYTLSESELLLMSDVSDISFDARYFGPVERSQIRAVIRPIITW